MKQNRLNRGWQVFFPDFRRVGVYISILLSRTSPVARVVYAKPPFSGPEAVLAYLSRYTHRVAISNQRLLAFDEAGVTFRYKDYRRDGADRQRVMTLGADEFIRRFLLHLLPPGFHRIRHYGLLSASARNSSPSRRRSMMTYRTSRSMSVRRARAAVGT
jgi:Putative transposase